MSETVAALLDKAHQALRAARVLLEEEDAEGSINRAYYAAFHAASAALFLVGELPRTHKGTSRRFWVRFVETGLFPSQLGGLLSHAQEIRERADYDAFSRFDLAAAADLLSDVEPFVEGAERLVNELQSR